VKPGVRHPWRVSHRQALEIQSGLARRVEIRAPDRPIRLVAGCDVAYSAATHRMYAAVVVVHLPDLAVVDSACATRLARFPYLPGLFSFRELPPLMAALARLRARPDALMFDGHGLAHPRRCGLACHAGVLFGIPALGVAKSILVGLHGTLGVKRGSTAALVDRGETVGCALRTRDGVRPVYVSPGHLLDMESSAALALGTARGVRLPEPVRLAHGETVAFMRRTDPQVAPPGRRGYPDFIPA
jgi:deoxyribonuclease V